MKLEDLKCCGNCEHFCNGKCSVEGEGGLCSPEPDLLCIWWKWDANTENERLWNGRG